MRRPATLAIKTLLAVLVTAICIWWLGRDLDVAELGTVVAATAPVPLAVGFALATTLPFWRAARLRVLWPLDSTPPRGALTRLSAEVVLWGFVLPFKLGELSFPWLLHRRLGLAPSVSLGLFMLVRLTDFAVITALLALGLAAAPAGSHGPLAALLFVAGCFLLIVPWLLVALLARWRWPWLERRGGWQAFADALSTADRPGLRLRVLVTSLGIWGTHVVVLWLTLTAQGVTLDAAWVVVASTAGNLAFALPIAGVMGLGPQQVAAVTVFESAGVASPAALAAALATYVVVAGTAVFTGLVARFIAVGPLKVTSGTLVTAENRDRRHSGHI